MKLAEYRRSLQDYLHAKMGAVAPNLQALIGDQVQPSHCMAWAWAAMLVASQAESVFIAPPFTLPNKEREACRARSNAARERASMLLAWERARTHRFLDSLLPQVAARLISHAGSLTNLSKYPASTVQILGAEKALFRALKTKGNTPKCAASSMCPAPPLPVVTGISTALVPL